MIALRNKTKYLFALLFMGILSIFAIWSLCWNIRFLVLPSNIIIGNVLNTSFGKGLYSIRYSYFVDNMQYSGESTKFLFTWKEEEGKKVEIIYLNTNPSISSVTGFLIPNTIAWSIVSIIVFPPTVLTFVGFIKLLPDRMQKRFDLTISEQGTSTRGSPPPRRK